MLLFLDQMLLRRLVLSAGEGVFFCDLRQTEWLFEGKGDSQFDTYRSMRKATNDDWKQVGGALLRRSQENCKSCRL